MSISSTSVSNYMRRKGSNNAAGCRQKIEPLRDKVTPVSRVSSCRLPVQIHTHLSHYIGHTMKHMWHVVWQSSSYMKLQFSFNSKNTHIHTRARALERFIRPSFSRESFCVYPLYSNDVPAVRKVFLKIFNWNTSQDAETSFSNLIKICTT